MFYSRFVHLLDQGEHDYAEEIEVERLRRDVVTEIRSNHSLEEDLNQMDIKIGKVLEHAITCTWGRKSWIWRTTSVFIGLESLISEEKNIY